MDTGLEGVLKSLDFGAQLVIRSLVPNAQEVILEAIEAGEAKLEIRDDLWWYCDPYFGDDCLLGRMDYDSELGLVASKETRDLS